MADAHPPPPPTTPAGWYPDPDQTGQKRYWDGAGWTDHRSAAAPPPAPPSIWKRPWFIVVVSVGGAFALVMMVGAVVVALGGAPENNPAPTKASATATTGTAPAPPPPKDKPPQPKEPPPSSPPADEPQTQGDSSGKSTGEKLEREMYENFGGGVTPELKTSWWTDPTSVEVLGEHAQVFTDVYPDGDAERIGTGMCRAAISAGISDLGITSATVFGSDGSEIASCP